MRYLFALILIVLLAVGGAYVIAGRGGGPAIQIGKPEKFVGASTPLDVSVSAPGGKLASLKIVLEQNGKQTPLVTLQNGTDTAGQAKDVQVKQDGADKL